MTPEARRAIFDRVIARMRAHGRAFEADAEFRAAVEEWIEGRITMQQLRARYGIFLESRSHGSPRHRSGVVPWLEESDRERQDQVSASSGSEIVDSPSGGQR